MSNLSELLPTGGGQNAVEFVATGTLASGQTVALKTDGTVEAVGETAISQAAGTPVVFEAATVVYTATAYDSSSNKVVIGYRDDGNSYYGTAVVGTVSGTSISFGTPVVFESANTTYLSATFDSNSNKIVFAYDDAANSDSGTAIVGTVSGTSISFGTAVIFASPSIIDVSAAYDSTNNKVVIAYRDLASSSYGKSIVGTVSGTSISFGSAVVFESATASNIRAVYDSTDSKIVVAFTGTSDYGKAVVGTVSGTSISFGTSVVFRSAYTDYISLAFDSTANKIVLACRSTNGLAFVGTVSGTSISFGSAVVFDGEAHYTSTTYDPNANKTTIAYRDHTNSGYGTAIAGTVSGTSISFGSEVVFETSDSKYISSAYDSTNNKVVIAYQDAGNSSYGTSVVFQNASTATNSADFIGITAEAISNAATGNVNVYGGINAVQTGLTIASDYYVQSDGSLSTATSTVKAGQAISATTINMKDLT